MKLEPANIVCPACGSGNYMRHLIGKNVGYLDMKCINCNSYFNFDELYKRRIGEVLKPKPITNADRIRSMTDEELAVFLAKAAPLLINQFAAVNRAMITEDKATRTWLDWLKQEAQCTSV
jgi:hypothetical protein